MKKTLLLCGALLAISATVASAAGVNLHWNDCLPDGVTNRNFTCLTTGGTNALVGSVVAPQALTQFVGIDVLIDLQTAGAVLPAWWDLRSDGCRNTSLAFGSDFSGTTSGGVNCADVFFGQGGGGISAYTIGHGGPNRARILAFWAVPAGIALSTAETYMFRMTINNQKTTGTGSCAGCLEPACIVLNQINLAQPLGVGDFAVTNAATSQHVTWQNATGISCPGATPSKSATWGQVKSLYR